MTKLSIGYGYPFAGKSTLARALAEELGLTRIALDEINAELNIGINPLNRLRKKNGNAVMTFATGV